MKEFFREEGYVVLDNVVLKTGDTFGTTVKKKELKVKTLCANPA
jgi:hypothetical protein